MTDDYNQPQNNFIKNSYRSCHSLMVLEEGRDILWLMIGRDNWRLQARPSIMSEPLQEVSNKINNRLYMCSTLSFKDISQRTLQDCTMTGQNSHNTKQATESQREKVTHRGLAEKNRIIGCADLEKKDVNYSRHDGPPWDVCSMIISVELCK